MKKVINIIFKLFIKVKLSVKKKFYRVFYKFIIRRKETSIPNYETAKKLLDDVRPHKKAIINNTAIGEKAFDLTIIVPVYNAQKHLRQCIESLVNQKTEYKYLVKFVDDGSTDSSAEILNEYCLSNSNFQVIRKNNGGAASARNVGLENLNSNYVMFVDADDYISDDAVQLLLDKAYFGNYDIVEGEYTYFDGNKVLFTNHHKYCSDGSLNKYSLFGISCNKVIKSELFVNFHYPNGFCYEDVANPFYLHQLANKVSAIDKPTYFYRHFVHIQNYNDKTCLDSILVLLEILNEVRTQSIPVNRSFYFHKSLEQVIVTFRRCYHLNKSYQKCIFSIICFIFDEYFYNIELITSYPLLYKAIKEKNFNTYMLCLITEKYS